MIERKVGGEGSRMLEGRWREKDEEGKMEGSGGAWMIFMRSQEVGRER